uniref:Uncharacterized protein n=1 Tax=Cyprinus carpio TaxID=7962 RepID=A0A8C2G8X1_CYPCA
TCVGGNCKTVCKEKTESQIFSDLCSMININLFQHICTCKSACLNLGKKISVPQDLMMEELNLLSNRGSIMFLLFSKSKEILKVTQFSHTGYGGPLKEVPPEKFNVTVIPKSYQSPWEEKPIDNETMLASISTHLPEPPYKLTPANYKCFNRAPTPFGGTAGTVRSLQLTGFEMMQAHTEPHLTWYRMCHRPNFNCTPRGWSTKYAAESPDL